MPTINPRVNVTLSPSLDMLVTRLAALERVSKAMVLRELLQAAEPSLMAAVALMQAAEGASAEARARMVKDMDTTIEEAKRVQHLSTQLAASATRDMVAEAEAIRGRRPPRRTRAAVAAVGANRPLTTAKRRKDPPLSNRGVKS